MQANALAFAQYAHVTVARSSEHLLPLRSYGRVSRAGGAGVILYVFVTTA